MLFFVLSKVPEAGTLDQKQATHFLHEVLWAKGYRVNTLGRASQSAFPRSAWERENADFYVDSRLGFESTLMLKNSDIDRL